LWAALGGIDKRLHNFDFFEVEHKYLSYMHFVAKKVSQHGAVIEKAKLRLTVLDLTRFVAMLMMIQGHTIYALADPSSYNIETFPWIIWQFLRSITAPVFLTLSGVVHIFANKRLEDGSLPWITIYRRIRIALVLFLIGYFLDLPAKSLFDIPYLTQAQWISLFKVNILQVFGVTLLGLLVLYLMTKNDRTLGIVSLVIALCITFLTPIVLATNWFNILPIFFAQFLTFDHQSLFTLFPYSAFMFYGTAIGAWLKAQKPERRNEILKKYTLPAGIIMFALAFVVGEIYAAGDHTFMHYEINNPGLTFVRISMVLFQIFVCGLILKYTSRLSHWYSLFGKRAIFIYVIHLAIIYGSGFFPSLVMRYNMNLHVYTVIPIAIGVIISSLLITYAIDYILKKGGKPKKTMFAILGFYLIFLLFF
jgi:uncharacterized membrane protein